MSCAPFSGFDVVEVMVNSGIYEWEPTRGDHVIHRWEPPADHDSAARTVPVPLHDESSEGTLRDIGDQTGMKDFQAFIGWIYRNR